MYIGADYYPEHWPHSRWEKDAMLMKKAGFNVVRLAEFTWVMLEPEEGNYKFDWLDNAIAILGKHGISVILGTPTAVMPAWLPRKYPNAMAVQNTDQPVVWGTRKNNCFTNGDYRRLSILIVEQMAEHYKDNPYVIGWQTDNEINGPWCYCHTCREEWRDWLRRKYGSLDNLNAAWGTHFWGQFYQRWDEIQAPPHEHHNPSLMLDWRRFNSWLNVRFQSEQIAVIRKKCPKHFITHNFMGFGTSMTNPYELATELDFVSWDNYPVWGKPEIKYNAACMADLTRGLKQKNFWIMEQTSGPGGWDTINRNPRPGEIRNIAFQQVAHGADAIIWFRWRTCTAGREQYWHGILGHYGTPGRRYEECKKTASDLRKISEEIKGTTIKTNTAIIYDHESRWGFETQVAYENNTMPTAIRRYYDALFRKGINVDIIPVSADLQKYKLVIAPQLLITSKSTANKLDAFVKNGGVLMADVRLSVKTETNLCHEEMLPAMLKKTFGIRIEEYEGLTPDDNLYAISGTETINGQFNAIKFVDWVIPEKAETLMKYQEWHMKEYAALTRNSYGKGTAYYLGAVVKETEFYDILVEELLRKAGIKRLISPPEGVEISIREGNGKKLLFIINHTEEEKEIAVPGDKKELISGRKVGKTICLDKYGVAVIKLS